MTDAKKCDITGEYYEERNRKYKIYATVEGGGEARLLDIGPTLYAQIEALLTGKKVRKKPRQKIKSLKKTSKDAFSKNRERMKRIQEISQELKKENPDWDRKKIMTEACRVQKEENRWATGKPVKSEDEKRREEDEYMAKVQKELETPRPKEILSCPVCGGESDEINDEGICENCIELMKKRKA